MRPIPASLILAILAGPLLQAQDEPAPLTDREKVVHTLNRLAFGPRPGQVDEVLASGLDAWIARELEPASIEDPLDARVAEEYPTLAMTPKDLQQETAGSTPAARRARSRSVTEDLRCAIAERSVRSERQLLEVLSDFWRNHFNVDVAKNPVGELAGHYEEAVIRAHALGSFEDLLLATAHHPAMLYYLDNHLSRKAPSKQELKEIERRVRRATGSRERAAAQVAIAEQRGLNENYARELMELHTLGVDNGYTQRDVEEVARVFTGWTVDRNAEDNETGFVFREDMHDDQGKRVLGKSIQLGRRDDGVKEGELVLKLLAGHRNTSEFVARKLCRRLVSDDPPEALVKQAASAYRNSKGDLKEVVRTIVTDPGFYDRRVFQAKFKTPFEFVASALRATDAEVSDFALAARAINELGLEIYGCEDPTGYSDATADWRDPGVMALRWKFAIDLCTGNIKGMGVADAWFEGLPDDLAKLPRALAARIVPQGLGADTSRVLERVLLSEVQKAGSAQAVDRTKLSRMLSAILIGCPEFQQQ
jgi:uncharacterized protein (DUF1800 family)